jgi:hypothetical protein
MTAIYDRLGVRFLYPENWKITEDNTTELPRSVAMESPRGGTWELIVYDEQRDADGLTGEVLSAMRKEYEEIEISPCSTQFGDVPAGGYNLYFYHLDLLVNSRALAAQFGEKTVLLLWQAEDREFEELEPVFTAMATSLLNPHKFAAAD